ncbi:hypothetical protein [Mycoplasmopsis opalescens]|uniref:hypothetical protein n=1 Tax=Mycoplasmopsis opalescens TaxID=114886 RepID=UPI0004A7586D|nr:hypothetical protein [Mycoplasmopsis opalescens]
MNKKRKLIIGITVGSFAVVSGVAVAVALTTKSIQNKQLIDKLRVEATTEIDKIKNEDTKQKITEKLQKAKSADEIKTIIKEAKKAINDENLQPTFDNVKNKAQEAINKLENQELKAKLQKRLDAAKTIEDAKNVLQDALNGKDSTQQPN